MARIEFYKKEVRSSFLEPGGGGRRELIFEIRRDFLTGQVSRILPFRRRRISGRGISQEFLEESKKDCPFCPDHLLSSTPRFTPEIDPEGRLERGKAVLFPNSFPYARFNWVVVFSEKHYIPVDGFSMELLRDAFLLSCEAIKRVRKEEPGLRYCSINWNYFPQSGGGILHPHLQGVMEESPTTSHHLVLEGLRRYQGERQSFFWEDYLSEERGIGRRYIGNLGEVHFLSAFSPRGILGEILILVPNRFNLEELSVEDWEGLSRGLIKVFQFFKVKGIESFNFSLFSGNEEGVGSWVYGRLCPRALLPPWSTSDINYFEKLHGEVICVTSPEELGEEMKGFFQ